MTNARKRNGIWSILAPGRLPKRFLTDVLPIFSFCLLLSFKIDFSVIRDRQIFPWDSRVYFQLTRKLFSNQTFPIIIDYPWGARILFPFLSGLIHNLSGISTTASFIIMNQISALVVCAFCLWLWNKMGIPRHLNIIGIFIFCSTYLGPLRSTIYYPGNGFSSECAICVLTFLCIFFLDKTKLNFLMYPALFILALGREFSTYIVLAYAGFRFYDLLLTRFKSGKFEKTKLKKLYPYFVGSAFSIIGLVTTHKITKDARGDFPFIRAGFTNGWEHLHLFNAVYPYYLALGPLAILILLRFTFSHDAKKGKISSLQSLTKFFAIIGFCFAMFVGGDTDRFIWWFFPFYAYFALDFLNTVLQLKLLSKLNLAVLITVTILWSRLLFPAIPPIQFVGEKFEAFASIRTDYSDEKFYGLIFLKPLREQTREYTFSDPSALNMESKQISSNQITLMTPVNEKSIATKKLAPAYRFRVNEYPIPFGFMHNQYEMFALHPQHGSRKIKIVYLAQWSALQIYITLCILRKRKVKLRKWV